MNTPRTPHFELDESSLNESQISLRIRERDVSPKFWKWRLPLAIIMSGASAF